VEQQVFLLFDGEIIRPQLVLCPRDTLLIPVMDDSLPAGTFKTEVYELATICFPDAGDLKFYHKAGVGGCPGKFVHAMHEYITKRGS
jgi:hypothetical protein